MTPQEKAKELVGKYSDDIAIATNNENIAFAKQCALICVDEMLQVLGKLRKPEYTTFIEWEQLKTQEEADTMDGYEYINLLEQVREEIEKL